MHKHKATPGCELKKLYVEETALFAINNIPEVDPATLEQFLALMNAGGTYGAISREQILRKMHLVLKYIPGASISSLLILLDLLGLEPSRRLRLKVGSNGRMGLDDGRGDPVSFLIELPGPANQSSDGVSF
jgi:hypothetical protein